MSTDGDSEFHASESRLTSSQSEASPIARLSFQPTLQAGIEDVNGRRITGTEIMRLMPHKGKLYAGTSMWMESDPETPNACQILVLDSPEGQWKVEHQFTENNLRLVTLRTVTFTTDSEGNSISPVTILLAAPLTRTGSLDIFSLDDETGEWVPMSLGEVSGRSETRAIGFHHDKVTGIDYVFAGTDPLGTIRGVYAPAVPGRIRWEQSPEFPTPPGERVMAFSDCNGDFYCAITNNIYRRTDGLSPSWQVVYSCVERRATGIRGLSAVPNPSGPGEVLLFAALMKVLRLDPSDDFKETIELDMPVFLGNLWGFPATAFDYVLAVYNRFVPYTIPQTGENVWLFGFQTRFYPPFIETDSRALELRLLENADSVWTVSTPRVWARPRWAAEARYFIRHADGEKISFEVAEIEDSSKPMLVGTRTIAVSPFPNDRGRVLYFGGYDSNGVPANNTAWIYRGELQ